MMTNIDKREILEQARGRILEASAIMRSIEMVQAWAERSTSKPREIPIPETIPSDRTADGAVALVKLGEQMNRALCGLAEMISAADSVIESISDGTDRAILRTYYIEGKTWAEVEEIMGLTERQCRRRRNAALGIENED